MIRVAPSATHCLLAAVMMFCFGAAVAHDVEPDLKLNRVKSFQVTASIEGPQGHRLTIESLVAPFVEMLRKRGKAIDQNSYDNVVSTQVTIAASGLHYAVDISFHYTEPCVATRLQLQLTCPVWEHYQGLEMFTNLDDATDYVLRATRVAAQQFDTQLDRH